MLSCISSSCMNSPSDQYQVNKVCIIPLGIFLVSMCVLNIHQGEMEAIILFSMSFAESHLCIVKMNVVLLCTLISNVHTKDHEGGVA